MQISIYWFSVKKKKKKTDLGFRDEVLNFVYEKWVTGLVNRILSLFPVN